MRIPSFVYLIVITMSLHCVTAQTCVSDNILSALDHPYVFNVSDYEQHLPVNISYIFADLKFDGTHLKLCEFGPGTHAGLTKAPVFIKGITETLTSPYLELFWHFLKNFNLPVWRIGGWDSTNSQEELRSLGGSVWTDFSIMLNNPIFIEQATKATQQLTQLTQAEGIIVSTGPLKSQALFNTFREQHPGFIYVNEHVMATICTKNKTRQLFEHDDLRHYSPSFVLCDKRYTNDLAVSIMKKIDSEYYVIKPVASMRGNGVIMVHKNDLAATLKDIILKTNNPTLKTAVYKDQSTFLVEAYVPSKTITVQEKTYDPTMRLVCFLVHDQGIITIHVIGGYWKTPRLALSEIGTLTDKHITSPHQGYRLAINPEDLALVKPLCADMMFKVYKKMLRF